MFVEKEVVAGGVEVKVLVAELAGDVTVVCEDVAVLVDVMVVVVYTVSAANISFDLFE